MMNRATNRTVTVVLACAVGAIVVGVGIWAQNDALVGVNYDDGIYAALAISVAEGDGYRLTYLPDSLPGVKYPPLYPLSLTPLWMLASSPDAAFGAMKLANGLYIGLAAGLFTFLLVELGILSLTLAAVVALLGFVSGSMMLASAGLLSEPLYLVLLFLALLTADRTREGASRRRLGVVGALAALVALTRMVGMTLVLAVLVAVWRRCGRRGALVAAAAAAAVLAPWVAFTLGSAHDVPQVLVPRYGSYMQLYLSGVASSPLVALDIAATNVGVIILTLGVKLAPGFGTIPQAVAGVLLIVLAVLGARAMFRKAPATATYPWLYLLVVATWTFPPFRFVFILVPLLLAFAAVSVPILADGAAKVAGRSPVEWLAERSSGARFLVLALAVLLAADLGYREVRAVSRRVWDGAELNKSALAAELIDWVDANTGPEAVVAYEFDPMLALHSGRTTVPNNYEPLHPWYNSGRPPVESLVRLFRDMRVEYVAVRRDAAAAVVPIDVLMGRYPGGLRLVHVTPGGVLVLKTDLEALGAEPRSAESAAPSNGEAEQE